MGEGEGVGDSDGWNIQVGMLSKVLMQTRIFAFSTSSSLSSKNAFKLIRPNSGRPVTYPRGVLQMDRSKPGWLAWRRAQPASPSGKRWVTSVAA